MKALRLVAVLAATLAVAALPTAAYASLIAQPFHADSGDACRYGVADGTLGWRFGATSPVPVTGVEVKGTITDRPVPPSSGTACSDDHYYSTVTFTAYAGSLAVDRQSRSADNSAAAFSFTLGSSTATTRISQVVVQVCRSPLVTVPPSYCGASVVYTAPPLG